MVRGWGVSVPPVDPVLPAYGHGALSDVVPALLRREGGVPAWMPDIVAAAPQVVLLACDGLGWEQMGERPDAVPTLAAMTGGPITSVAPSTTATALTSLSTGRPPAEHGIVGYRMHVGEGEILNVLRWRTGQGDARALVPPGDVQRILPFLGTAPPVVTRAEFEGGGFSDAHLPGVRNHGWRMPSTLVTNVRLLLEAGEPFVYAYYDGVDKIAHEYGLGVHYEAELRAADRLVADLIDVLPRGAVLVVTSDHGQVDVGANVVRIAPEVMDRVALLSGEGRFRWLHARPGMAAALAAEARRCHSDQAWVHTREEVEEAGWFGGPLSPESAARLGDVVLAAIDPVAFLDPVDSGPVSLMSRHGSLTAAEMLVPLLATG
jgi:hypothetical protein